jgi:hypothetical protein
MKISEFMVAQNDANPPKNNPIELQSLPPLQASSHLQQQVGKSAPWESHT